MRRALIVPYPRWPTHAALAGLFHDAGFEVDLLGEPRTLGRSRRVAQVFAPGNDAGETLARLLDRLERTHYDRVVVIDEGVLERAAESLDAQTLARFFPIPFEKRHLISKAAFIDAARDAGIAVPESIECTSPRDAAEAAERFGYPLVVKGIHGHGGEAIRAIENRAQLDALEAWPLVAQPLLEGFPATAEVLYARGVPVCWYSSEMVDCWPNRFAPSTSRRIIDLPGAAEMLATIGEMTAFDGLAGIDWFVDRSGRLLLIEMNLRPTTCYDLVPEIRAGFVRALRRIAHGETLPPEEIRAGTGRLVEQFPQHLYYAAFEPNVAARRRAGGFMRALSHAEWDDPRVVLAHLQDFAVACYAKSPLPKLAHALKTTVAPGVRQEV